jgi:hypothetical protein
MSLDACLANANVETYKPHTLHGVDRCWPETNCYIDVWIEILNALDLPPQAALGFAARQDFEGDQFTFTKFQLRDLETLFGLTVQELSLYDPVETHVARQIARGRMCLIEADPYFLPDTGVAAHRVRHGKTTIAVNRIDLEGRRMEYFHGTGYFALERADFDGLFRAPPEGFAPFRPYTEFTTLTPTRRSASELKRMATASVAHHWRERPAANPVRAFQTVLPARAAALAGEGQDAFHDFAFHNLRLLGANFELLASALDWISEGDDERAAHCMRIAECAKTAQFQLAKALARRRFDGLSACLDPAAAAWDELFEAPPVRKLA